jgi:hypothetical protein
MYGRLLILGFAGELKGVVRKLEKIDVRMGV